MAVPLCMKRMAKERPTLEKPNDDYFVFFDDDNMRTFHAYVVGPEDSLYEHKFIKIKFDIPDRYPLGPPSCKFIQHRGGRIHPNLYVDGKVCLSILGTWPGEPWALAMSIDTVLITMRSLLDSEPYKHEPGQKNNVAFNKYVQYGTWTWLLLDYLNKEKNEAARAFLESCVARHADKILADLQRQKTAEKNNRSFSNPYKGTESSIIPNYSKLVEEVTKAVETCRKADVKRQQELAQSLQTAESAATDEDPKEHQNQRSVSARTQTLSQVTPANVGAITEDSELGNLEDRLSESVQRAAEKMYSDEKHQADVSIEVIDLT